MLAIAVVSENFVTSAHVGARSTFAPNGATARVGLAAFILGELRRAVPVAFAAHHHASITHALEVEETCLQAAFVEGRGYVPVLRTTLLASAAAIQLCIFSIIHTVLPPAAGGFSEFIREMPFGRRIKHRTVDNAMELLTMRWTSQFFETCFRTSQRH